MNKKTDCIQTTEVLEITGHLISPPISPEVLVMVKTIMFAQDMMDHLRHPGGH